MDRNQVDAYADDALGKHDGIALVERTLVELPYELEAGAPFGSLGG